MTTYRIGQSVYVNADGYHHRATVKSRLTSGRYLVVFARPVRHPYLAGEWAEWLWLSPDRLEAVS